MLYLEGDGTKNALKTQPRQATCECVSQEMTVFPDLEGCGARNRKEWRPPGRADCDPEGSAPRDIGASGGEHGLIQGRGGRTTSFSKPN